MALRVIWQFMDRDVTNITWTGSLTKTNRENINVKYNIQS